MGKIVLNDVTSGYNVTALNSNFQKIEDELNQKVLYRDNPEGEPNVMENDLDMNAKRIYNLPKPVGDSEPVRLQDIAGLGGIGGDITASNVAFEPTEPISATDVQQAILETYSELSNRIDSIEPSPGTSLNYTQVGAGAVERTLLEAAYDEINVFDFMSDAQIADTKANTKSFNLQAQINNAVNSVATGVVVRFGRGTYKITEKIVANNPNTTLLFESGAVIEYATPDNIACQLIGTNSHIIGGKWVGPAAWDGTNTSPTYGVIRVSGDKCSVKDAWLVNVRKVGLWFKDVEDGVAEGNLIEGNYPEASWTGVETGHWGVVFDPNASASGGNFRLNSNTIKGCVQGCQPGNYGLGQIVRGFVATGNIFEGCWNHGIYSNFTDGATITGNTFNRCQIPVVISGSYNVVSGNSMYTAESVVDDQRDVLGISIRDGSFNTISDNVLRGVLDNPSNVVAINVQDVSGVNDLVGNVISGNVVDIAAGLGLGIRISASTRVARNNIVANNVIRCSGVLAEAALGIYGASGIVGGPITAVTKANPGVITCTSAHGLSVNDVVIIRDVQGMTQINGSYLVNTVPTATTLTLKNAVTGTPLNTTGFGTYTSGGEIIDTRKKSSGNKVIGNNITVLNKSFGMYLIQQDSATIMDNTIEYQYSPVSPESTSAVAFFDCYNSTCANNSVLVRRGFGANLTILGFREFGATVTVQTARNIVYGNQDQVDKTMGAVYQHAESLNGSGLIANVVSNNTPTLPAAVGSTWIRPDGTPNNTLYVKQTGTGSTGWTAMGVAPIESTGAAVASISNAINTAEKFRGKLVWDTTNNRLLYSTGSAAGDRWDIVSGLGNITPV